MSEQEVVTLRRYSARKLLSASTEQLRTKAKGTFLVLFEDDKEVKMTAEQLVVTSYFWDIHRELPWLPIVSKHCLPSVLKGKLMESSTHRKFFEQLFWYVHDQAIEKGIPFDPGFVDRLNELVYRKSNEIYNYACTNLERFAGSTDIEDYIELLTYPPMAAIVDNIEPSEDGISSAYQRAQDVIMNDPNLANNPLVVSARAGIVKMSQLLQCTVVRGYVTDIDSKIFPKPSMGNFVRGFADYYSLLIDTRTAAKSLHFSASLLRMTEYNSRKLQILCQSIQNLHLTDCGSQHYMSFKLQPDKFDEAGNLVRKNDLMRFAGKYFLDEETNQVRELTPNDSKYLGRVLKFRSPLAGCAHPDPHGVCKVCFGAMAVIVPEHTNIGYMLAAALMQILAQSILSNKHVDKSSNASRALLTPHQARYLEVDESGMSYRFNRNIIGKEIFLTISEDQMSAIASLQTTEQFENVSPSHFSDLNHTMLRVSEKDSMDGIEQVPLDLSNEKRNAFFTREALMYIKQAGWVRADRNIVIDFSGWDNRKPFASLPRRHFNNADHAKEIADLIQGSSSKKEDIHRRKQDGSPTDYFADLYNIVNSRLDVPAVIIEHIIYGASIRNSAADDYRLPKAGTGREMGLSNKTVHRRGAGPGMGFEDHVRELFVTTKGFKPDMVSSHPMDVFVMPREAVADAKRRGLR